MIEGFTPEVITNILLIFLAFFAFGIFRNYMKAKTNSENMNDKDVLAGIITDAARKAIIEVEKEVKKSNPELSGDELTAQAVEITINILRGYGIPVPALMVDAIRSTIKSLYQEMKHDERNNIIPGPNVIIVPSPSESETNTDED